MESSRTNDYSISLVRFIATVAIIICHIFQYLDIELMWWFNVGVQIFLCMSGYLYGRKGLIDNDFTFYKKNLSKVLINYYVVTVPMFIVTTVFVAKSFSGTTFMQFLFTKASIPGGEHLWYIPYCIICYLITPILSRFFEANKDKHITLKFIILGFCVAAVIELFFQFFVAAWFICYMLGYFLGHLSLKGKTKLYNTICLIAIIVAIALNTVQIIVDYIIEVDFTDTSRYYYLKMCRYAHVGLGTSLFLLLKKFFTAIFSKSLPKPIITFCRCSDKYSYDIYLVHQFVILGPLTLMALTPMLPLNIIIILAIIIASAITVNLISNLLRKRINKLLHI